MVVEIKPLDVSVIEEMNSVEDPNRVFHNLYHYGLRGLAHLELLQQANKALVGGLLLDDLTSQYDPVEGKEPGKPGLSLVSLC